MNIVCLLLLFFLLDLCFIIRRRILQVQRPGGSLLGRMFQWIAMNNRFHRRSQRHGMYSRQMIEFVLLALVRVAGIDVVRLAVVVNRCRFRRSQSSPLLNCRCDK